MFKAIFAVLFLLLITTPALADNLTMTTYYPAPAGDYNTLRAKHLEVSSELKMGHSEAACDENAEGTMRYNKNVKKMEFCDGTVWTPFATGLSLYNKVFTQRPECSRFPCNNDDILLSYGIITTSEGTASSLSTDQHGVQLMEGPSCDNSGWVSAKVFCIEQ